MLKMDFQRWNWVLQRTRSFTYATAMNKHKHKSDDVYDS